MNSTFSRKKKLANLKFIQIQRGMICIRCKTKKFTFLRGEDGDGKCKEGKIE